MPNNHGLRIALTGLARSGKDTVATLLKNYEPFQQFAFGDSLKQHAHDIFGQGSGKDRELYQWFGQAMRSYEPDIWIRKVNEKMSNLPKETPILITDLRQPNEYEYLFRNGFYIVRVRTDKQTRIVRMKERGDVFDESMLTHETEQHVEEFDVHAVVLNNGTIDELAVAVDNLYQHLWRKHHGYM